MSKNFYNVVLLPPEPLKMAVISFAQKIFNGIASGYCLSPDKVFPHVTLCQSYMDTFQAASMAENVKVYAKATETISLSFNGFYVQHTPAGREDISAFYCGLSVSQPHPELLSLHNQIVSLHKNAGMNPLNAAGELYWPHLTLALIKDDAALPSMIFNPMFWREYRDWTLMFGRSDVYGQFLGPVQS